MTKTSVSKLNFLTI
jgi:hypothetical protein